MKKFFTAQPSPDNVQITVLSSLQKLAETELAGRDGAVVALNPKTGAILAMYSNPSYDPNPLSSHNLAVAQSAWEALQTSPGRPAAGGRVPAALLSRVHVQDGDRGRRLRPQAGRRQPQLPVSVGLCPARYGRPGAAQLRRGGVRRQPLALFTVSCDTGFAQLGLAVGPTGYGRRGERVRVEHARLRSTCPE